MKTHVQTTEHDDSVAEMFIEDVEVSLAAQTQPAQRFQVRKVIYYIYFVHLFKIFPALFTFRGEQTLTTIEFGHRGA